MNCSFSDDPRPLGVPFTLLAMANTQLVTTYFVYVIQTETTHVLMLE